MVIFYFFIGLYVQSIELYWTLNKDYYYNYKSDGFRKSCMQWVNVLELFIHFNITYIYGYEAI